MSGQSNTISPFFRRDALTWLAYLLLAYYSFMPSAIGPVMPFLRSELRLSYGMGGLHLTAVSFGILLGGFQADKVIRKLGRKKTWWLFASGVSLGILGFSLGYQPIITIASVFLMGFSGSFVLVLVQAILSEHHGTWHAVALTEANIGASLSSALAPIIVSVFTRFGWSWRVALYFQILFLTLIACGFIRLPIPEMNSGVFDGRTRKLPAKFWVYWTAILLFVAVEWCLWVWGADFFVDVHRVSKVTATSFVSIYLGIGVVARIIISRLTRRFSANKLLIGALGISCLGFPFFWLVKSTPFALAGYIVAGLGVTNLYPLGMSLAVGCSPGQLEKASARVSMGIGMAGLSAPLGLGWLADHFGIEAAFGSVLVLLSCVTSLTAWAYWYFGHSKPS